VLQVSHTHKIGLAAVLQPSAIHGTSFRFVCQISETTSAVRRLDGQADV